MSNVFFGPWVGEFGWELMSWQGFCRATAKLIEYDKVYVSSFPDMGYLYQDFADEFIPHDYPNRKLDFENIDDVEFELPTDVDIHFKPIKRYKLVDQHFIQYGTQLPIEDSVDILIHARNIRIAHKNYPEEKWEEIVSGIRGVLDTDSIASIGKAPDLHIRNTYDLRGIPLSDLCDYMISSQVVVGGSSGIMHLATLCNTPIVVWGDRRTYFNESLETRYRKTWNPFGSEVHFLYDDKWQPDPQIIVNMVYKCCNKGVEEVVDESKVLEVGTETAEMLAAAVQSGRYLLTISYIAEENPENKYKFAHKLTKHNFPDDQVIHCLNHFRKEASQTPSAKAELQQSLSKEIRETKRFA